MRFYIDGVLIPVEFLVNHRSILWDDRAQEVCSIISSLPATMCCWRTARRPRATATTATAGCSAMPIRLGPAAAAALCAGPDRRPDRRCGLAAVAGSRRAAAGSAD